MTTETVAISLFGAILVLATIYISMLIVIDFRNRQRSRNWKVNLRAFEYEREHQLLWRRSVEDRLRKLEEREG